MRGCTPLCRKDANGGQSYSAASEREKFGESCGKGHGMRTGGRLHLSQTLGGGLWYKGPLLWEALVTIRPPQSLQ